MNLTSEIIISDLLKLIDHLNLKNIILCGLSIGGLYAATASLEDIDVKGLVLINTLRKRTIRRSLPWWRFLVRWSLAIKTRMQKV